jgi:hypothetical protein
MEEMCHMIVQKLFFRATRQWFANEEGRIVIAIDRGCQCHKECFTPPQWLYFAAR